MPCDIPRTRLTIHYFILRFRSSLWPTERESENGRILANSVSSISSLFLMIHSWSCFSRPYASKHIPADIARSRSQFDLRSRLRGDPSTSYYIWVDASLREKRNETTSMSPPLLKQKLLVKNGWWLWVASDDVLRGGHRWKLTRVSSLMTKDGSIPSEWKCYDAEKR